MTEADVIAHWREGAKRELSSARLLHDATDYASALFHCHLAVEKALKADVMEKTRKPHPKIHNLGMLAVMLKKDWNEEEQELFDALSSYAVAARYDDPAWARQYATEEHTSQLITAVDTFFRTHLP